MERRKFLGSCAAVSGAVGFSALSSWANVPPRHYDRARLIDPNGAPLKARALAVLRRLRARVGTRITLVAVGGIETADDAWARIRAGATLVQGYTGFIYGGPAWPRRLQRELAGKVRAANLTSIKQAIGADA